MKISNFKLSLIFLFFITFGCNYFHQIKYINFDLEYHLLENTYIDGEHYCDIANKAFENNPNALLKLATFNDCSDGTAREHGIVLIELIDKISENQFIEIISSESNHDKFEIYSMIMNSLQFTPNTKYYDKTIYDVFPLLAKEYDKLYNILLKEGNMIQLK